MYICMPISARISSERLSIGASVKPLCYGETMRFGLHPYIESFKCNSNSVFIGRDPGLRSHPNYFNKSNI